MPFYEYVCATCGKDFVLMRAVTFRTEDAECPYCNEKKAMKKVSLFASSVGEHSSCGTGSSWGGG